MRVRLILVCGVLMVASCGGEAARSTSTTAAEPRTPVTTHRYPTEVLPVPDPGETYQGFTSETLPDGMTLVARAAGEVDVFDKPGRGTPFATLDPETILGTPTVVALVEGPIDGWARVMLPVRPNGTTGWVDVSQMPLYVVSGQVHIDLSERTLTYSEMGSIMLVAKVAVGTAVNPTPTGTFFVTDSVSLSDPQSPWGPHALGLSARSDTITEYNGGDGIIGIHGTNRPSSIGQAASLGCVRLPNHQITTLHQLISIGTPVVIEA